MSINSKSKHTLWLELCDIVSKHPRECDGIEVEKIIRQGISKFTDEVGSLWLCLADYFIRLGHFSKARAIFDEAINSVSTVHDFSLLFEQYQAFLTDLVEICDEDDEAQLDL